MRTIFASYRVSDLDRPLAFNSAFVYQQLDQVTFDDGGRRAKLSADEPVATLRLAHRRSESPVHISAA